MTYELNIDDTHEQILIKVDEFLLEAMDLLEQSDEEKHICAAWEAFSESLKNE